jgi:light-regulated signal transduction histidine kinase (bacteriophytochrome)
VTSLALAAAVVAGIALAAAVGAGVAAFVLRRAAAATGKQDAADAALASPLADLASAPAVDATATSAAGSDAATEADHASFGYIVSHDLRAPIRVVEGFTKIVKEDYGPVLDAVGHDHLDRVLGAAARMNSMIDALLQLSRLSSQPIARVPVNLSQIAGFVVDDLRCEHPEREVEVEIEAQLLASGDPTLLRMLLENLLGNAWKYTGNTENARIGLARRPGEATGFTVHDNGAGFDMRYADRLFGVFQRLHSASEFPGTGVGLASVRRIVRRHHGEIWAESEPERGARFHFTLPLASRGASATR